MAPLLGEEPKSYRMLRLFKLMLTQSPQEILNNSAVGETIPYSLVLFYLFSYAPDEMKSPHEVLLIFNFYFLKNYFLLNRFLWICFFFIRVASIPKSNQLTLCRSI